MSSAVQSFVLLPGARKLKSCTPQEIHRVTSAVIFLMKNSCFTFSYYKINMHICIFLLSGMIEGANLWNDQMEADHDIQTKDFILLWTIVITNVILLLAISAALWNNAFLRSADLKQTTCAQHLTPVRQHRRSLRLNRILSPTLVLYDTKVVPGYRARPCFNDTRARMQPTVNVVVRGHVQTYFDSFVCSERNN